VALEQAASFGVIIAGSGPTDRNGNTNSSSSTTNAEEHSNAYLFLAHDLAERGIATLRYDKRGVGASIGAMRGITESQLVFTNYSQDALQFALHVKAVTNAPCVCGCLATPKGPFMLKLLPTQHSVAAAVTLEVLYVALAQSQELVEMPARCSKHSLRLLYQSLERRVSVNRKRQLIY